MGKEFDDMNEIKDMGVEDMLRDICEKGDISEEDTEMLISKYRNNKVIDVTDVMNDIRSTIEANNFTKEHISDITSKYVTDSNIDIGENYPNIDNTSGESTSDDEIDDTVSKVDRLNKIVRETIYDDLRTKLSEKDFIEPSNCDVYLSHIMCHMYEVNPDTINDRFTGKLEVSFIANRSSDNIVTINVSNFITCYTKSNVVKTYHISYCVLVWCYLDGYDTNSLIKFIFNTTTRRFINEFKFNEIDDTPWNLPTTMRHIKKIANKYSGLIKYSNSKFSNGTGKVSIRNMSFNLGNDMNDAVTEFDNEFSDLDYEEEE